VKKLQNVAKRNFIIALRLSRDEGKKAAKKANKLGLSLSAYARKVFLGEINR